MGRHCQTKVPEALQDLTTSAKAHHSSTWKSILKGRDVLVQGLGVCVKNGQTTKFWLTHGCHVGLLLIIAFNLYQRKKLSLVWQAIPLKLEKES